MQFLVQHTVLLPEGARAFAVLDRDVRDETIARWRTDNNHKRLSEFKDKESRIDYLPWTPEVGILNFMMNYRHEAERMLREEIGRPTLTLMKDAFNDANGLQGADLRKAAKRITGQVAETISALTGTSQNDALRTICRVFAKYEFGVRRDEILGLLLPKIA